MCQHYEAESQYVSRMEMHEIRQRYAKHESGEALLSEKEIKDMMIRVIMLRDQ